MPSEAEKALCLSHFAWEYYRSIYDTGECLREGVHGLKGSVRVGGVCVCVSEREKERVTKRETQKERGQ